MELSLAPKVLPKPSTGSFHHELWVAQALLGRAQWYFTFAFLWPNNVLEMRLCSTSHSVPNVALRTCAFSGQVCQPRCQPSELDIAIHGEIA